MKKLISAFILTLLIMSCDPTGKKDPLTFLDDFQLYSNTGKFGNDKFSMYLKPLFDPITPLEAKDFFDYRKTIHNNYDKINFSAPLDSILLNDFYEICQINKDGGLIFNLGKNDKNLKMQIVGIKKYNRIIEVDSIELSIADTSAYRIYGRQAKVDNKEPYASFEKYPYIYFDKTKTSDLLLLMKTFYTKNPPIYFYYGYSRKSENDPYHPSVLFSIHPDLENTGVNTNDPTKYAFANRGGVCCPPPPL
jgi:hypothetical protein